MPRLFLISLALMTLATGVGAQTMSIENVYKLTLRNSDAIRQGSQVKGYYFFYISNKIDRKTNEYTLKITDENLKSIKDITFEDSKDVRVLESAFNGTDLVFLLYNDNARTFEYQVYGTDGKKKFVYNRELTRKERRYLESTYFAQDDEESTYKGLYPIEGQGFLSNMPSREDKDYTFQVDYFSSDKRKSWTFTPTVGGKKFIGDYLGTFNGVVFFEVLKFTSLMDGKPDSYITGLDLETGRQLFEKPTDEGKYRFYPASMSLMNDGKAYIFGEYFNPNGNIAKDKSLGFAFWNVDEKGTVLMEKYNSWDLELGKYLNVTSKGKIDNFGYMYLHNMVQTSDGRIFAIGEGYQKVASGLGIAANILTGGRSNISNIKIRVTDMILVQFDKDFNVKDATIYDKNSNRIELPSGMEFVSAPLIGKLIKYSYGGFDYAYTQMSGDNSKFIIYYSDFVRGKDYKGRTFNSIAYNDGKVVTNHIETKSDASHSAIYPGKQGQVMIVEYFRKTKHIDAHFAQLD